MAKLKYFTAFFALVTVFFSACKQEPKGPVPFQLLRSDQTGLHFDNALTQSSAFNVFNYMYFYNGGGVAAGDFNQDGRIDLYFSSNMGPNRLFLNEGKLKFKDVTDAAGVAGMPGWTTGVSVVDINNDGLLDIYTGQLGEYQGVTGKNQLFICKKIENGIPVFQDEAALYQLDLTGFSTQATFVDFDLDGDLDVFQLNHTIHQNGTFGPRANFLGKQHPLAGDRLLRNDTPEGGQPKFTDISKEAGIQSTVIGYGLGIATGDVNNDGFPDIYIGNDFHENDYLYLNNGNGTFTESLTSAMMHTSQFSMGVDIVDINNDGWQDIYSLDMLPDDPYILKSSLGEDSYDIFHHKIDLGYFYQYTRNNLQLNNGDGSFSEIGLYAGIAATDWSWSPLFFDIDDDGFQDLFVSNGIPRRMNDIDYLRFQENRELQLEGDKRTVKSQELSIVEKMPRVKLPNRLFRNRGNLQFDDLTNQIGGQLPSFSNGAACADLDNDGDIDIVTNNIEDQPFIYENRENKAGKYLKFNFDGPPKNRHGIGARVLVYKKNGSIENAFFFPVKGFQSSAHVPLHIGVGDPASLDSVVVIWPDRGCQRLAHLAFDTLTAVKWVASLPKFDFKTLQSPHKTPFAFTDVTARTGLQFTHKENPFVEFNRERLMPNMVSTEGPAAAVGDINGDGLDDLFLGSSKREQSAVFVQNKQGKFTKLSVPALAADSVFEDVAAVWADIESDGDLDLVIAAGGNEFRGKEEPLKQRVYRNDGHGAFTRIDPFPNLFMTASAVVAADFNKDGQVDFFFAGRALPWHYGRTPDSHLMMNRGNGAFEDATERLAPELGGAGLIKNAVAADMDGDGDPDLLLAMEWGPVTLFVNDNGKLVKHALPSGDGWWNTAQPVDMDGDGDLDIIAGNTGKNCRFKPTKAHPVRLYVQDFDKNGEDETLVTYYLGGREIPFANFDELVKTMPILKKKYLYSKDFAKASLSEIFGEKSLKEALIRQADCFESIYLENTPSGFQARPLPENLQWSTMEAVLPADLNGDGKMEALIGGNFYDCNIEMGRYDASYGQVLSADAEGKPTRVSSLGDVRVKGQTRRILPVRIGGKQAYLWVRNNDSAVILEQ